MARIWDIPALAILLVLCGTFTTIWAENQELPNDGVQEPSQEGMIPSSEESRNYGHGAVTFYLYTHKNQEKPQIIRANDYRSVKDSHFDPSCPTRILIPGWLPDSQSRINAYIKRAYFSVGKYNIIVVDYSAISYLPINNAPAYISAVGIPVAELIDYLCSIRYLSDLKDLHLVGHHVGAHICGCAARRVRNGRVGVIHALDAAGPLFEDVNDSPRLLNTDARYVQVMHTNTISNGYGYPLGHVDFYPNWGKVQLACTSDMLCSSLISINYFAESITNPRDFVARQCKKVREILDRDYCTATGIKVQMGTEPISKKYHGVYYIPVRSKSPYGCGDIE